MQLTFAARRGRRVFQQLNLQQTATLSTRAPIAVCHVRRVFRLSNMQPVSLSRHGSTIEQLATLQRNHFTTTAITRDAESASDTTAPAKKKRATKAKAKSKAKPKTKAKPKKKPAVKETPSADALAKRQAEREAKKVKNKIAQLKEHALKKEEPKLATSSTWSLFLKEKLSGVKDLDKTPILRAAGEEYRNLSAAEREALEQRAARNKEESDRNYTAWVNTYTPLQIKNANLARKRLALYTEKHAKSPTKLRRIKDERQVKRSRGAYFMFYKDRTESGDFKNMSVSEVASILKVEYNNLSENEKERYASRAQEDKERYLREYLDVYGEEPQVVVKEEQARKKAENEVEA